MPCWKSMASVLSRFHYRLLFTHLDSLQRAGLFSSLPPSTTKHEAKSKDTTRHLPSPSAHTQHCTQQLPLSNEQ